MKTIGLLIIGEEAVEDGEGGGMAEGGDGDGAGVGGDPERDAAGVAGEGCARDAGGLDVAVADVFADCGYVAAVYPDVGVAQFDTAMFPCHNGAYGGYDDVDATGYQGGHYNVREMYDDDDGCNGKQ